MWSKPKAVDIDYSCLWIVLPAERFSCVLQMKDFFLWNNNSRTSKNTLLSEHWTTHARHASGCTVLLLKGEAMINIFQLLCEHVFCLTTHLCWCLDGSFLHKVDRTQGWLDKSGCEVLGVHTRSTSSAAVTQTGPGGPVKPNSPLLPLPRHSRGDVNVEPPDRGRSWEVWR